MDPQTTQQLAEALTSLARTTAALAWHQQVITYLLVALVPLTIIGFWRLASISAQIHRETTALLHRLPER